MLSFLQKGTSTSLYRKKSNSNLRNQKKPLEPATGGFATATLGCHPNNTQLGEQGGVYPTGPASSSRQFFTKDCSSKF
jgi:hypothetical protein